MPSIPLPPRSPPTSSTSPSPDPLSSNNTCSTYSSVKQAPSATTDITLEPLSSADTPTARTTTTSAPIHPLPPNLEHSLYTDPTHTLPPSLLPSLTSTINTAYVVHDAPLLIPAHIQRIKDPSQIGREIGSAGQLALYRDATTDEVVACAALKPWRPRKAGGEVDYDAVDDEEVWEVKLVACRPEARYQGKGLVARLVAGLEQGRVDDARVRARETGMEGEKVKVTFLLCTLPELNGRYWRRRGYETFGGARRMAGEWGAGREFWVDWMGKSELI